MSLEKIISNQKNLERILDNLSEGIIAHGLDRRIFFFNQEAERITGYRRQAVIGRDCHEVFGAPFCGERCSFCEDRPQNNTPESYTVNITSRSGDPRRVQMSLTVMNDENGTPFGVLASLKDVTDLLSLQMRRGKLTRFGNLVGQDIKMLQVFQQIKDVAGYDYPVNIYGETGTGKELVAEAIHNESRRGGAPFVPINCGALPEGLIESELFGHVKGAFSGAIREKKGRFELAHGGTVFLDEVSELSKHLQVKLLRFLQEGTFEKVGGERTLTVDVRLISATNKELKGEVKRNHFREDLYYRLNVIPIRIPPLQDRKTDIPLLVEHFLKEAAERYGGCPLQMSRAALALLLEYPWPGNVRELQNTIQFAIVKSNTKTIHPQDLPFEVREYKNPCSRQGVPHKLDIDSVQAALQTTGGNKVKAAKLLGVGRATLYRFLKAYRQLHNRAP